MKMEKYIIIKRCTREELKTMLNDWLVLYVNGLRSKMIFEIAEINPNSFVLKVDKSIDDTDFFYMVNYFVCPFDMNRTFEVEGYATATKHRKILNKKIYVFVNEIDNEDDNVWITTEDGETYKFDFGGRFKKMNAENNFKILYISDITTEYEQIHVDKKELLIEAKRREDENSKRSVAKRFKILSTILFVLIPSAFLINRQFPFLADDFLLKYFCAALVTMWFVLDYRIFGDTKRTLICMLLSLIIIFFGINSHEVFLDTIATIPLSSTVVMWTVNHFFGTKLGDIYDTKWDRLVILALIAIAVLISIFIFNPILRFLN